MNDQQRAEKAKLLVKEYLLEGISMDWIEDNHPELNDEEEMSWEDFEDLLDEADDILDWLAQRFDTALTGRR